MKSTPPTAKLTPLPRRNRKDHRSTLLEVGSLAHNIINQLTIIHLACHSLGKVVDPSESLVEKEIARLQKALEEMHKQVELLSRLQDPECDAQAENRVKRAPLRAGCGTILSLDAVRKK